MPRQSALIDDDLSLNFLCHLCTLKAREKRNYAVNMQSSSTACLFVYIAIVSTHNKDFFSHSNFFSTIENEKSVIE